MKKFLNLSFAALLAMVGCAKVESDTTSEMPVEKTVEITLLGTRATISDSGSGAASFAWEAGDHIGVQVGQELKDFELVEFDGDKAKFRATIEGELEDGAFIAYPYVPEDCVNGQFAVSYPSVYEVDKADAFRLRWSGTLKKDADTGEFYTSLENTAAIFRVTYASVPDFVQAVTLVVDGGEKVTVKFSQAKEENMNFYFPLLEGDYDAVTVALETADGVEVDGTAQTLTNKNGKISVKKGKIYRTPTITLNLYELMTDAGLLENGKYVLAYYDAAAQGYKLFSFQKAMDNCAAAAALVKDVHGLGALLGKASQVYSTVVKENYVAVSGKEGALAINVPAAAEELAMFEATGNSSAGKVSFASDKYTVKVDKLITSINADNSAILAAQFNAPDLVALAKDLRGTEIPVTFDYLIDFAVEQAQKEGITFTDAQVDRLRSGFEHLCRLAKQMIQEKLGKELMDIDLQTNVLDVFERYYDNVCDYSLQVSEEKKFGWATPIGFHAYDDGFTTNIAMPNYGWFNRLNESLKGTKEECVAYWAQFDSQYKILEFENFFSRAANRALKELDASTYAMLQEMANANKFTAIGKVYKKYVERFNDQLEPVYIYKKVE